VRYVVYMNLIAAMLAICVSQAFSQTLNDQFDRVIERFQSKNYAAALFEADAIIAVLPAPLKGAVPSQWLQDIHYVKAVILKTDNQCGAMLNLLSANYLPGYFAKKVLLQAQCNEVLNNWLAASSHWESYANLADLDFEVTPAEAALARISSLYANARWRGPGNASEEDLLRFDAALATLDTLGEDIVPPLRLRAKTLFLFGQVLKARHDLEQLLSKAEPDARVYILYDIAVIDAQLGNWSSVLNLTQEAMQIADPDHPMLIWLRGFHAIASGRLGITNRDSALKSIYTTFKQSLEIKQFRGTNFLYAINLVNYISPFIDTDADRLVLVRIAEQLDWSGVEYDHFGQLVFYHLTNQAALIALDVAERQPDLDLLSVADRLLKQGGIFRGFDAPAELKIPEFQASIKLRRMRGEQDHTSDEVYSINDLYRIMGKIAAEDIALTPISQVVAEQQKRIQFRSVFEQAISATFSEASNRLPWRGSNYVHYPHQGEISGEFGASYGVAELTKERLGLAFEFAQHARLTTAGRAMASTLTRLATGSDALSDILRAHDTLLERRSLVEAEQSQEGRDARLKIDLQLKEVTERLQAQYPQFDQLLRPNVLGIAQITAALGPDEAVLKYVSTDAGLFAFLLTPEQVGFNRQEVTTPQLAQMVEVMRKGLDPTEATRAAEPLQPGFNPGPTGPKFDFDTAKRLYALLLRPHEERLSKVKTLYIVPDGPLLSLPFSMLVRGGPDPEITSYKDYARVDWAIRHYAFSTVPILSALPLLKKTFEPAPIPFVGIGNPQLSGLVSPVTFTRGVGDQIVDPDALRSLAPLPETAQELRQLNTLIAKGKGLLFLGGAATEPMVRSGQLKDAQVIAFATHGLLGGDILGMQEPALVLSPPDHATEANDGLLSSSEIARLKLNAAWVILSACNTAGGNDSNGTEGLSGLARAFLYAGTRGLLVSHWPVQSDAAVVLTTGMFERLERGTNKGGPAALQQTILQMIDFPPKENWRHPSVWAPFVVIGK
jgi:CHAT domain-containing protein